MINLEIQRESVVNFIFAYYFRKSSALVVPCSCILYPQMKYGVNVIYGVEASPETIEFDASDGIEVLLVQVNNSDWRLLMN